MSGSSTRNVPKPFTKHASPALNVLAHNFNFKAVKLSFCKMTIRLKVMAPIQNIDHFLFRVSKSVSAIQNLIALFIGPLKTVTVAWGHCRM